MTSTENTQSQQYQNKSNETTTAGMNNSNDLTPESKKEEVKFTEFNQEPMSSEERTVNSLPTTCILGCGQQLILSEMKAHLMTECENVEVDCPQLCGKKVARKNINGHLDNECAHTRACKLKEFGCKFVARGVDWEDQLKQHLSANATDHIEKLAEVVKSHSAILNPPKSECQVKCEQKIKEIFNSRLCKSSESCQPRRALCLIFMVFFFSLFVHLSASILGGSFFVYVVCYFVLAFLAGRFTRRSAGQLKKSKKLMIGAFIGSIVAIALFSIPCDHPRTVHPLRTPTPRQNRPGAVIEPFLDHHIPVPSPSNLPVEPQRRCNKPHHPENLPTWFTQDIKPIEKRKNQQFQQHQQPLVRPFKTCMLENGRAKVDRNKPLVPVFQRFSISQGQHVFSIDKHSKDSIVAGFIFPKYFHGSAPIYIYEDAQKRNVYTVDYLSPEEFPALRQVGKLGYVDADRLNC